jgi:hypothetical protein
MKIATKIRQAWFAFTEPAKLTGATPSVFSKFTDGRSTIYWRVPDGRGSLLINSRSDRGGLPPVQTVVGHGADTSAHVLRGYHAIAIGKDAYVGVPDSWVPPPPQGNNESAGDLAMRAQAIGYGARATGSPSFVAGAGAEDRGAVHVKYGYWWYPHVTDYTFGRADTAYKFRVGNSGYGSPGQVFGALPDGSLGWFSPPVYPGTVGVKGDTGPKGPTGDRGPQGPQGTAGVSHYGNIRARMVAPSGINGTDNFYVKSNEYLTINIPNASGYGANLLYASAMPIEVDRNCLAVFAITSGIDLQVQVHNYGPYGEYFRLFYVVIWL